ncbi:MAG: transposase [Bryobacteraceae bacterium]|nr:transposase [Bryobacteraceae bacterium]
MPRRARLVLPGVAHHVTQRGNNRQQVFFSDEDRAAYLDRLFSYCALYSTKVLAYCLMPNHVHIAAVPSREGGLARVFGRLQADYARYANLKLRAIGHLWQERYFSTPMDDGHTIRAMAYVERNPLRANMVQAAEEFVWSSASVHVRGRDESGRIEMQPWAGWYSPERWKEVLAVGLEEEGWRDRLREATRRGLPFGASQWVGEVERQCGRDLSFRPPGRPPAVRREAGAGVAVE